MAGIERRWLGLGLKPFGEYPYATSYLRAIPLDVVASGPKGHEMADQPTPEPWRLPEDLAQSMDADLFIYNGMLLRPLVNEFIDKVNDIDGRRRNFALFLTTLGGDGDAAYKMASFVRDKYNKFSLYCY
jgi:hypothetical protein